MKRVLVAMSGGIDSTVASILLKQKGYEVEGITFRLWEKEQTTDSLQEKEGYSSARVQGVADQLNIPLHILDLREEFRGEVVEYFCSCYKEGKTPNPCVLCNKKIKWHYLMKYAMEKNFDFVSTGHYAQIAQEEGRFFIEKGADFLKDQSYFLWQLGEEELKKTLFPLGDKTKNEVREIFLASNIHIQSLPKESMDICFVDTDYRDFLKREKPEYFSSIKEGDYVDFEGNKLGKHEGYLFYTIGQRRKLGIALGYPAFVTKIIPEENKVQLGTLEKLFSIQMRLKEIHIHFQEFFTSNDLRVRIRYRSKEELCKVELLGDEMIVTFLEPVSAITPGQSAVFYLGERVVGGGIIM